ncbi:MAG: flagellin [Lachnospiraceae bacterium]|nr:flagellin [Lachnospiraceae bacterium]
MSNSVINNLLAMNSNRQLGIVSNRKAKTTEKLSSGYRINRSADDAAGLAISEKMRRQIRGLSQASLNCQDGVSLVQTADGAMAEVHDMLDRCTELSVKAANGTLTNEDRSYIQKEISAIKEEIDSISDKVTFNEIPILKGDNIEDSVKYEAEIKGGMPSWVDGGASFAAQQMIDTVTTSEGDRRGMVLDFSALDTDISKLNDLTAENTGFYTTCCTCQAHYSINFVSGQESSTSQSGYHSIFNVSIDGVTNGNDLVNAIISAAGNNPNGHFTNLEANGSKLVVYDNRSYFAPNTGTSTPGEGYGLAGPGVAYAVNETISETKPDLVIQAGAESGQTIDIKLPSISCHSMEISGANVLTQSSATSSIEAFKQAKEYVSRERSRMGAYQNRLEHTINNLNNVIENTTAAESQIRDTDMSTMMMQFTKDNILEQAGQAILAQANQSKQGILTLLQ